MNWRVSFLLAALVSPCSPIAATQAEEPQAARQQGPMLAPPTPREVNIHITALQNGQQIEVGVNQRFAIELVGTASAGYRWTPAQMPAFIVRAGEAGGPTIAAQNQPGYAGGNDWQVTMFAATGPGAGEIVMEEERPWETNQPPAHVFRVTIVAR